MRRIVLSLGITIDGYIARKDGSVDYLFMPEDFSMAPFFAGIDAVVMGRKTYDAVRQMGGSPSGSKTANYVFSRAEKPGKRKGATFVNEPVAEFAARLRAQGGKNVWLMGGGELARGFLEADEVDELHLGIVPILLGEGIPMFPPGFRQLDFELDECGRYSKGMVFLRYSRSRGR